MPTFSSGRIGRAIELLEEHLELTAPELAELMGISHSLAFTITRRLCEDVDVSGNPRPKRAHVSRWVWEQCAVKRTPRAVFALGDKPDAKKPKLGRKQCERDYWHRNRARALIVAPSIFALGDQINAYVSANAEKWQKRKEKARA